MANLEEAFLWLLFIAFAVCLIGILTVGAILLVIGIKDELKERKKEDTNG